MNKYELTNPQKSIWVTEEFYKGTSIENIAGTTLIKDKVDFEKLKKAINIFVKNADGFRLKFVNEENKIKQYIADYEELLLDVKELESEKDVKKIEKDFANTPFKIFNSFLFRFQIYSYKDGRGGFVVVGHHLIVDAWACGLVISEIMDIYDALIQNIEPPTVDCSYLDYIKSEQDYLLSEKFKKDKAFWMENFSNVPDPVTLPGSLPNKEISCQAKRKIFKIPSETMDLMASFCKENKISPFNFFMGVYSIYLSRVNNVDEFVMGTPILNRSNAKEKHTIGMFISVVPFKVSIPSDKNFIEFAKTISADFFDIFRHQKYPYQTLLEDLRKQNTNLPNLYNVMLSYQNMRMNTKTTATHHETKWLFNNNISDDVEIHFFDINDNGVINVAYDYKTSKYTADDIYAHHSRILHIINQILENNNILLKDIEIVTPDEKDEILYKFNNTAADYPKDKTIVQLFEEQVEKTPDNIAVVFEDKSLTYKELNEKANSLANYLRNNSVGNNDLVGIMVNRSLEMIISILAVLKAGGAYIPIDPNYPKERIEYMLSNSNSKLLLTQKHLEDKINFENKVFVDLNNFKIYSHPNGNLENINTPEDLAYVIFTSGSTGLPKGVMLKNKNIVNFIYGMKEEFHFTSKDIIASITTISFDIFVLESLMPLLNGLKIIIANEDEQTNVGLFNKLCVKNNVNIIQTTPSRMQIFTTNENELDFIKNATHILIGGEPFPVALLNKFEKITSAKIYNMYGPTETAVWSSLKQLINNQLITIGKPIINTQIYILDKTLKPVPVGIPGELYIAGDGVGKGYLNNEELTNKSFIDNPFIPGAIMYKTGDLGMFCNNGEIICLGRLDNQIKIRGLRIELGEIEGKLCELPSIKSCAVVKKVDELSHEFLCAYYTSENKLEIKVIREHLQKYLPNYMVPQYFIQIDKLPYTPNGKIDAKKLPMPEIEAENKEIVLPRNEIDSKLINILKELLNINSISIDDNFFELGGDSLSAINLCAQIQSEFNVQLFVRDILENAEVQKISDIISNNINTVNAQTIKCIQKSEYYTVSSAQKRMYFASQVAGDASVLYNIPGGIILEGNIDINKLEVAFKTLINRHESLRTYFELIDGNVVQKVLDKIDFKLDILDKANFEELDSLFRDFVKPFDLSKAPLFRAKLIKFNNNKSALFVDMHHIISDGASLNILVDELCKIYNGKELPQLNITYKDYASFENERFISGALEEAENYWGHQFEGEIPVLNLPTKNQRPAVQSFEGKKEYFSIDSNTISKINNIAKELNVTPYMLLLACYYILLSKYTSQDDIVVGTPVVGRDIAQTQNLIGMFVNTLALRENIDGKLSFKDFVLKIKENLLNSYKYQTYPFDELVNKLEIKRDTSRNPLFDTMFIYQNNGFKSIQFKDIAAKYYVPDTNISKFDLSLEVIPNEDGAVLSFEYATKLFDEEFIKQMSIHYLNILNVVLENINIQTANIDMLLQEEKNKILYEFNNTKMDYPKDKTIVELFEEQVEKTPDNLAVIFEDQSLTYKELNEKANSLANYLKDNGVQKGNIIPVLMDRSLELLISIFAIIKCGGVYLPISPEIPAERIDYILQDSKAKTIITKTMQNTVYNEAIQAIVIDDFDYSKYSDKNISITIKPADLLYVIYTSGSTGNPKGVKVCHRNLVNFVYSFNKLYDGILTEDKLLASTNISFDVSIFEIFMPLLNGASLYLYNEPNINDIFKYCKSLIKNKITFAYIPPNILDDVYNILSSYSSITIDKLLLGVEPIKSSTIKKYYSLNPNMKIVNAYGPTETTICATGILLNKNILNNYKILPIGFPLSNLYIFILDKDMQPVPVGIPGEIYISGDNVSKGYLNNKELTEKNFISIPNLNCKLAYKTGDLAKWDNNGIISFIGRNDSQIKVNGHRIELGEIESCIYSYPNIDKVVVLLDKNNKLNCYYTSSKQININDLKAFMQRKLPEYFIPNFFVQIENFKLTANGKIDKKALQKIKLENTNNYIAPETDYEKKLVSAFETILGKEHIGITDNFFELGGDSLLAIKLQIEAFNNGLDLSYKDIFKYPTVEQLSKNISESKNNDFDDGYDYKQIDEFLKNNSFDKKNKITKNRIKNILLTGSTGFMGSHILDAILKNTKCNIYCLIRAKNNNDPQIRLLNTLRFYFGNKYDKEIFNRIIVIEGDISKDKLGLNDLYYEELGVNIDCVINSAAIVKHYGNSNDFNSTNIQGAKNIIEFCNTFSCKLFHLSTLSVSGNIFETDSYKVANLSKDIVFNEQKLYIGQDLSNVYIYTKFIAERLILENIMSGKLDGKIIRLGNITNRYSDGIFQINVTENAFLNRINSILHIGCIPDYLLDDYIEFSPVDSCADAILKLVFNQTNFSIYHVYNNNHITFRELVNILNELKVHLDIVDKETFNKKIQKLSKDPNTKNIISGIINDFDENKNLGYNTNIILQNELSNKILKELAFKWPKINQKYLRKYIIYLKSIGYIK